MRRFIMALLTLAARISSGVGWSQQKAYATATLNTTSTHKIVNENNGFILGILFPSLTAGSTALQWSNNGTADHRWQFISAGSGCDVIPQPQINLFL